jgi:hypothetical protein
MAKERPGDEFLEKNIVISREEGESPSDFTKRVKEKLEEKGYVASLPISKITER